MLLPGSGRPAEVNRCRAGSPNSAGERTSVPLGTANFAREATGTAANAPAETSSLRPGRDRSGMGLESARSGPATLSNWDVA